MVRQANHAIITAIRLIHKIVIIQAHSRKNKIVKSAAQIEIYNNYNITLPGACTVTL
jgi:hypothetical protein